MQKVLIVQTDASLRPFVRRPQSSELTPFCLGGNLYALRTPLTKA